tara:strand:- start:73 stop:1533 length:1461 start_codon:yes stop_codon:yes gene_type:complete
VEGKSGTVEMVVYQNPNLDQYPNLQLINPARHNNKGDPYEDLNKETSLVLYTDGSSKDGEASGAAVLKPPKAKEMCESYENEESSAVLTNTVVYARKRLDNVLFPNNNDGEAMAVLLAVTMFDESAKNLTINVRTDSKMVMDAWKKYESGKMTEKERRTHPLRLYLMAMKAKLHELNRTVKIEHVRAHWAADDQTDRVMNAVADHAANLARVKRPAETEAEKKKYVMDMSLMEDTFTMKERPHQIKAKIKFEKKTESKDDCMAKIVAGGLGKTVEKLMYSQMIESRLMEDSQHNVKTGTQASVSISYGYASLRLAIKKLVQTKLDKRDQTFLLRLVSSTLPTMEMVHKWKGVSANRDGYEFLHSAVVTDKNETSPECPLCDTKAMDTQGHWVACKSLRTKWKDETNHHWKSVTGQLPKEVDLVAVYENNEINYVEKCGLIKKKTLMDLTTEIDEKDLTPWKMTMIRKTLLKVATTVWYYKQNLLST